MEYQRKDFFVEKESTGVDGFVVIDTDETRGYRVAERWEPPKTPYITNPQADSKWLTYWIPARSLAARVEAGKCEQTTTVSDKQFRGVMNLAGVDEDEVAAPA